MKPIAFMVMPFGTKDSGRSEEDVPTEVDFDALWTKVYFPVLEKHYTPVRADEDFGAAILLDMIQRLAAADVVVADITIANANVYYELGVRHAARDGGCVLVAADWSKPLFDLAQVRRIPFPLADGSVPDDAAAIARDALDAKIVAAADKGSSPVFAAVPDFPKHDKAALAAFREFAQQMSDFHAEVHAISLGPAAQRDERALDLARRYQGGPMSKGVAWELMLLLRDHAGWEETVAFIKSLDDGLRASPEIDEQYCLALSGIGDHAGAAARLTQMIATVGGTPERYGLLGGRHKRLMQDADGSGDALTAEHHLDLAIDAYSEGMLLDLNEYYCSSNLPRLLRRRGERGDESAASRAEFVTRNACVRALERGEGDEWLRPTLLNAAFDIGDVDDARDLAKKVQRDGHAMWQLETCIDDLRVSAQQRGGPVGAELGAIVDELASLLPVD